MPEIRLLRSLQRRVAGINALAAGAAMVIAINGARLVEDSEHQRHLDLHLQEVSQTVLSFVEKTLPANPASLALTAPAIYIAPQANEDLVFQVWLKEGAVLLQTNDSTSQTPLMPLEQLGFGTGMIKGAEGRKYALQSPNGRLIVQVGEQFEDRSADFPSLLLYYLVPMALPLLFSTLATWCLQRRSANALDALVKRLRDHDLLDARPIALKDSTHEMTPVVEQVNSLFLRANQAILTEQRFTAMAAHELRTPWSGIKAQAQIAQTARTDDELQEALRALVVGINRASHVFDQLFDLARMESLEQNLSLRFDHVRLASVFQQVVVELDRKIAAKKIVIATQLVQDDVQGLGFALYLLMRNLLSNAVMYSPAGGRIEIAARTTEKGLVLCVDDSGPGIPAHARTAAFERFNRLNQHGPDGVGLGLSIVNHIVKMHGALIELQDSHLGGLRVRIFFPARGPTTPATEGGEIPKNLRNP